MLQPSQCLDLWKNLSRCFVSINLAGKVSVWACSGGGMTGAASSWGLKKEREEEGSTWLTRAGYQGKILAVAAASTIQLNEEVQDFFVNSHKGCQGQFQALVWRSLYPDHLTWNGFTSNRLGAYTSLIHRLCEQGPVTCLLNGPRAVTKEKGFISCSCFHGSAS